MRIEAEADSAALRAFTSAEGGGGGGGGCSVNGGALPPIAQDAKRSIAHPASQQTRAQPGCGPDDDPPRPLTASAFDCEHFQFIDDEDDDDDEPAAPSPPAAPASSTAIDGGRHLGVDAQQREEVSRAADMSDGDEATTKAVRRQESVDEVVVNGSSESGRELRSALKKKGQEARHRGRITFDEAVTLYSDECDEVQLLQLSTGPDILYPEEYYAFDPPIEYQDVPPFDPPAEYRDADEGAADVVQQPNDQSQPRKPDEPSVGQQSSGKTDIANGEVPAAPEDDVRVAKATEPAATPKPPAPPPRTATETGSLKTESTEESDKLFERFLEAEREFSVDEELNNVFHVLENDFANDSRNGAFDDNFFRKLINLLSSVEGDVPVEDSELFSSTNFTNGDENGMQEVEDDDVSQTHSRTLSEADSDCSISSQDTIIVRLGEEEGSEETTCEAPIAIQEKDDEESAKTVTQVGSGISETYDEVFNETKAQSSVSQEAEEKPRPLPRESLLRNSQAPPVGPKPDKTNEDSLSRQSSGEQSTSGNSQEHVQDADDSTSSDSRSGEVEEEIRLDDIGYDEEDAEDYDEESFRGMAHGNSKIRRIIKKNALQCTMFRGIEAKRRQQPGAKYPRPKSPLLSQESLVEKLKWLTTIDEQKDHDATLSFHSKPPDVILSTGGVPVNGNLPHSASSEDDMGNHTANYSHPQMYPMQQRHVIGPNGQSGYYIRHDEFPPSHHPSLPRQRMAYPGQHAQMMQHTLPSYPSNRIVAHPPSSHAPWPPDQPQHQRPMTSMTVPRNFRDWRVIQRVMVNRNNEQANAARAAQSQQQVPADYVRCPNGAAGGCVAPPPDVSRTSQPNTGNSKDELEQFVEQDCKRIERIRKRYSLAEDDDDPTFGFARRPSVRGVQTRVGQPPHDLQQGLPVGFNHVGGQYQLEGDPTGTHPIRYNGNADQARMMWNRDPNWRPDNQNLLYGLPPRSQVPMHLHRASVALTELPGSATIPHVHRKSPPDTRYHSYAESMYGSTRTLPTTTTHWLPPPDARTFINNVPQPPQYVPSPSAVHQVPPGASMLQVPVTASDERGVPEGASSSPKISTDSLYHATAPDAVQTQSGQHKDDGMIYYSLNV